MPSALVWTIVLVVSGVCWLGMWLITKPKGGSDGNKD